MYASPPLLPILFVYSSPLLLLLYFFWIDIWGKVENRRSFFEEFAQTRSFDPLKRENWYEGSKIAGIRVVKVFKSPLLSISLSVYLPYLLLLFLFSLFWQGLRGVLSYHEYSLAKALVDLFPDVGLDFSKIHVPRGMIFPTLFSLPRFFRFSFLLINYSQVEWNSEKT